MNPDDIGEISEAGYGDTIAVLISVTEAAVHKGWRIVGSIEQPPRSGYVQHGHCVVIRGVCPFPEVPFAVLQWARRKDGEITFSDGDYDLNRIDAFTDLVERSQIERMEKA